MDPYWHGHKLKTWSIPILLGIAYVCLLYFNQTITGMDNADGIIGVLLGLYICSLPAAAIIDQLFFRRSALHPFTTKRAVMLWLAINLLTLLIGWLVLFLGTTRLICRID
jgi:hypothetical protein